MQVTLTLTFQGHPKVKSGGTVGLLLYGFLIYVMCNIWPNSALLQDIRLQNLSDLDFNLSFQVHLRSYLMVTLNSPYNISY